MNARYVPLLVDSHSNRHLSSGESEPPFPHECVHSGASGLARIMNEEKTVRAENRERDKRAGFVSPGFSLAFVSLDHRCPATILFGSDRKDGRASCVHDVFSAKSIFFLK